MVMPCCWPPNKSGTQQSCPLCLLMRQLQNVMESYNVHRACGFRDTLIHWFEHIFSDSHYTANNGLAWITCVNLASCRGSLFPNPRKLKCYTWNDKHEMLYMKWCVWNVIHIGYMVLFSKTPAPRIAKIYCGCVMLMDLNNVEICTCLEPIY